MTRRDEVEAFLGGAMCPVPGVFARTVTFLAPGTKDPVTGEE
jgi:hypothetical protein